MAAVEEVATIKDSPPNKRFIGDVVNGLVVVNTLVYIGFIAAQANGKYQRWLKVRKYRIVFSLPYLP